MPRGHRIAGARSRRRLGEHVNIPRLKRSFHFTLPCDPPFRRPAASLRETRWCFLQQASRHREPVERQQLFRVDDVRRSRFPPSTHIRFITNRPSLLSTSSTRRAVASPCGSVSTSCGARRGYSVSLSYPFLERLRQFLSPDGRTGASSRPSNVSSGPHPFWAKRCSPRRVSAPSACFQ